MLRVINNYQNKFIFVNNQITMRKPPIHKSLLNAFRGIFLIMKSERNFQLELFAFAVNVFLIFYLKLSSIDTILILLVSFGVLVAEIFNTAIEKTCDFIQPEFDKKIGFIKDISAGGVILTAILSVIVGILVYWKYIF
ncbi:diacylglycerol kinase family protein [Chryseobacterium formosus]|nr:diacylglycerol kinase family protein [Chryseobacterium formosus]